MLLTGLEQPQDAARFSHTELRAAGKPSLGGGGGGRVARGAEWSGRSGAPRFLRGAHLRAFARCMPCALRPHALLRMPTPCKKFPHPMCVPPPPLHAEARALQAMQRKPGGPIEQEIDRLQPRPAAPSPSPAAPAPVPEQPARDGAAGGVADGAAAADPAEGDGGGPAEQADAAPVAVAAAGVEDAAPLPLAVHHFASMDIDG